MKKVLSLIAVIIIIISFAACGSSKAISENVEIAYGENYKVENEKLQKYDSLVWSCDDNNVATVDNGVIVGNRPGTAVVSATSNDKVVATYTVTVVTVPVSSIVLSTNTCELTEGEELQLHYTLFPDNASDYGLNWKSADSSVATVDEQGKIVAVAVGQTTVSVANTEGIVATCSVSVLQKPAYERLSSKEKDFVDSFLAHIKQFKNIDSVVVKEIEFVSDKKWKVEVSAQNGFGGNGIEVYFLDEEAGGFWNYKSYDLDYDVDITPDNSYDIALINEAIAAKR